MQRIDYLVIHENPEWFVSSGRTLLNILEGLSNNLARININEYSQGSIYLLNSIHDKELFNILIRIEPKILNLSLDEALEYLRRIKFISGDQYAHLRAIQHRILNMEHYDMKVICNTIRRNYNAANRKYTHQKNKKNYQKFKEGLNASDTTTTTS